MHPKFHIFFHRIRRIEIPDCSGTVLRAVTLLAGPPPASSRTAVLMKMTAQGI